MSLYENTDGTGSEFNNIKGWGSSIEKSNLGDIGFNDVFSAFQWTGIVSKKDSITLIHLTLDGSSGIQGLSAEHHETNDSARDQTFELSLEKEDATEVTTSTTDQHVAGITTTFTQSATTGVEDIASTKFEWSVAVKYEYTRTDSTSRSQTQTIALNMSPMITAPPFTFTEAAMVVSIGRVPAVTSQTTAERWYREQLVGTIRDGGLWKRTEPVKLSISGSLAVRREVTVTATPLKGHEKGKNKHPPKQSHVEAKPGSAEVA